MGDNNYADYSVGRGNVPRRVIRKTNPLGVISLICGISSTVLFLLKGYLVVDIFFGLLRGGMNEDNHWIKLIFLVLFDLGKIGIIFGVFAQKKDRQDALGKSGFTLSIIGEILARLIITICLLSIETFYTLLSMGP